MRRAVVVLAVVGAAWPAGAAAHGPCTCVFPAVVEPGDEVRAGPAYLVVWNPTRDWFVGGAGSPSLASAHRRDAPSRVVMLRDRPPYPHRPRRARFRVPRDSPPGLYLALIFDGSEGGSHATWDYVHVRGDSGGDADAAVDSAVHPVLRALLEVLPRL